MKEEKHKSIFRLLIKNSFLIAAYSILFLLVVSLVSPFINPHSFWIPAFTGLAFPYIFTVSAIFFFFILLRGYKKHLFIFLPFILYATYVFSGYYHPGFFNDDTPEKGTVKIMSFNVRLFDLYNWKNNEHNKNKIFNFLKKEDPAIICFQEYYYQKDGKFSTSDTLVKFLKAKNVHASFPVINRNNYCFGIATLTKFPIINKGEIIFPGTSNMTIYTDIIMLEDTVRIYNNHLESIRFGKEDYEFIDKIDFKVDSVEVRDTKNIIKRIKHAYSKRAAQADSVAAHIAACKYPVIVCGDFNDTPVSYSYNTIRSGLSDAYIESGSGIGSTYNGKIPLLRIDYIFHSPKYKAYDFKIGKEDLSDHFPITCLIGKTEK
ncbi:MAG: endonuclease/exonuclease/phosphatase family protein [Bacteroidia bacterium]|nr:endonuclease/exonuclease/phosphatase family protein [Bacteroidia bacterium]